MRGFVTSHRFFTMRSFLNTILLCVILLCFGTEGKAQDTLRVDSININPFRFSVLTSTPGTDVYAHFGHTAILLEDTTRKKNAVFNYGCFDDTQKNFVVNFIMGNTNYLLEAESLDFFLWRYGLTGNGVYRQELNLKPDEALRLTQLLAMNLRPENQTYLYNWLYDNCTERARDVIEAAIDGVVKYERKEETKTVRQMLHEKLTQSPWLQLGIDIILGEEIDQYVGKRIRMFLPDNFEAELEEAYIEAGGGQRKMVAKTETLLEPTEVSREVASPLNPMVVFGVIQLLVLIILWADIKKQRTTRLIDILLLTAQGTTGVVVAGLFFLSKHPAVDSNWMVIAFNPLFLIQSAILAYNWKTGKGKRCIKPMEYANMAVLIIFSVCMLCTKQCFNPAVGLIVSTLLTRTGVRIFQLNR